MIPTTTNVYGRVVRSNQPSTMEVIGQVVSEHDLSSAYFEVVELDFKHDYRGVESSKYEQGGSVLTFSKTLGGYDRDIVSPIVLVSSSYRTTPIHVLSCGFISTVQVPPIRKNQVVAGDGSVTMMIVTPGKSPETVTEWQFQLPIHSRLDRKIFFIKPFNIYVGACNVEQFMEIRDGGLAATRTVGAPKPLVDIHIRGNIHSVRTMHFNFNGIFGKVNVEPTTEVTSTITLRIGGTVLTESISNKDLLTMKDSIYLHWEDHGGIELLIDYDRDRLSHNFDILKKTNAKRTPEAITIINGLRQEIDVLSEKIDERDNIIKELKRKLSDNEYRMKLEQEEHKTMREKIKSDASTVSDTIKIVVGVIGLATVVVGVIAKMPNKASTTNKLIEWSIPFLLRR